MKFSTSHFNRPMHPRRPQAAQIGGDWSRRLSFRALAESIDRGFCLAPASRRRQLVAIIFAAVGFFVAPAVAGAAGRGTLSVVVSGLPSGQPASIVARGPGFRRLLTAQKTVLRLPAGTYTLSASRVAIVHAIGTLSAGATAFPASRSLSVGVKSGQSRKADIAYAGIVNPGVQPLPPTALGFLGDPNDPSAVMLPRSARSPAVGTIFTSGPKAGLPSGLVAKVVSVADQGNAVLVALVSVPVSDAIPEINYSGNLRILPAVGSAQHTPAPSAPAHSAESSCKPPKLLHFGAHFDSIELRRAVLTLFPSPQMAVTVALRTTESLGVDAAAVGINCDFDLFHFGPYHFGLPIPFTPLVVPGTVVIPFKAGIHVQGTLKLGTINLASTTVAAVAAGHENYASLSEQGSNIWLSNVLSLEGTANLSVSAGVLVSLGIAKTDVHVEADFGPEFEWTSGQGCHLSLKLGVLTAGARLFGHDFNSPPFGGYTRRLWSGCDPGVAGGPGGGGSTGTGSTTGTSNPGDTGTPGGTAPRSASSTSYTGATTGSYHHPVTLSARLVDLATSSGLAGRTVDFTLGSQSCSGLTGVSGDVSCSITLNQTPGDYSVGASFAGDATETASAANAPFTLQKAATTTTYTGPHVSDYYDAFTASARLTDSVDGTPVAEKAVTLVLGNTDRCQGVTDASGNVACSITPTQTAGAYSIVGSFTGDGFYLASSDTKPFTIAREETVTTLTAAPPTSSTFGQPVAFTAVSAADPPGGAPAPTGSTAFAVDATPVGSSVLTNGSGNTATASLRAGLRAIAARYGGDHNFLPSSAALSHTVTCDVNINGSHQGALIVTTTTCLAAGSHVTGPVIVKPGGALDVESSAINGAMLGSPGAGVIRVCGSTIAGAVRAGNSAGLVLIGDPGDASCAPNRIGGALDIKGNAHGVEAIDNVVVGAILTESNSGPGPYPGDTTIVSGNHKPAAGQVTGLPPSGRSLGHGQTLAHGRRLPLGATLLRGPGV